MATTTKADAGLARPEFAVTLGLLPPYTVDDVKRAYLDKVKDAHPDRGGDRAEFDRIQHAYEQANEYLRFRADRRQWMTRAAGNRSAAKARWKKFSGVLSLMRSRRFGAPSRSARR